jgi:hypothetical protein
MEKKAPDTWLALPRPPQAVVRATRISLAAVRQVRHIDPKSPDVQKPRRVLAATHQSERLPFDFTRRGREWLTASGRRLAILRVREQCPPHRIRTTGDLGTALRGLVIA